MKKNMVFALSGLFFTGVQGTVDMSKPSNIKVEGLVVRWTDAQELNTTKLAKEKVTELELINGQATAELQRKQEEYRKLEQDYSVKRSTLSKSAREAEESKMVALNNETKALVETSKMKVGRAVQEKTEEMVVAVEQAAAAVAKAQGIDVIIDTTTGRTLYASDKAMVTADLVSEMNKQFEIQLAQNKAPKNTTVASSQKKSSTKA
jgi:outer membrane OmpH-like protein